MESFFRRKLGSSLQKPVSSYQFKLPELSSSFYSIADEPFPQVSGFLDETVSPSFISNETALSTPACTPSENQRKSKQENVTNDSGLNGSFAVPCHLASGNASNRSVQNEKDMTSVKDGKVDVDAVPSLQALASADTSDLMSEDLKNSTFDVTQDLKEPSDNGIIVTVDLQNIKERNGTFDLTHNVKEPSDSGTTATADLPNIKENNSIFNLTQDSKEQPDTGANKTVDLQNIKEKNSTFDFSKDSKVQSEGNAAVTVDLQNIKEKNGTFNLTQDLKELSDTGTNRTVDQQNINVKNGTFNFIQDSKEQSDTNTNTSEDLQNIKDKNGTFNLTQDLKELSDTGTNRTVYLQNIKEKNSTFDLTQDSKDQCNPGTNTTVDLQIKDNTFNVTPDSKEPSDNGISRINGLQNVKEKNNTVDLTHDSGTNGNVDLHKGKNSTLESQEPKVSCDANSTVDIDVPNLNTESGNATVDLVQSHDPKEGHKTTVDIPNIEITHAKTASSSFNSAPLNTTTEQPNEKLDGTVDIQDIQQNKKQDGSLHSEDDKGKNSEEAHFKVDITVEEEQTGSAAFQPSGDISRNSIFSLDETLNMKTNFMFTSTPIVFGKESRFEVLRDTKPTPMRKRLSVINSIEAQSNDELVCTSNHDGTDAIQTAECSNQKVLTTCPPNHTTSESANENKPPAKPPMKRRLPQLSSKISYAKSSFLPPPSSINSSVVVKPKTVRGPQAPHPPNTSTTPLRGNRRTIQMKTRNIAPVKNTAPVCTVKTSVVSSVPGYNFTAIAKPSNSGIPQMKPSGLQPPTRKRLALKTPQTALSSVESAPSQPSNKSAAVPGMRTRNSLLSSVGQKHSINDGLPSAKRKRIGPAASSTVECDGVHPTEGEHQSGCVNCLQHEEKLESVLRELKVLRSDCKNWGPLHEKLELCIKEMKRI
ncbi:uncharacterized protein si:ch211-126c2.4 isoform X2 [Danio aesculapii]|uniref:uncharacterized protein si:ch211-126c2.4 isoform X2 n=1 Tax=Danio aesculapii TaxID=1142201 RepID=UPI0024BFB659|nr:uncharacterized protein si:ch211-126c2.4 isoform X2 [Danio aesculapii]